MVTDLSNIAGLRRNLHALAELSCHEEATAAFIAEKLATSAPDNLLTGLGGHGVLAVFNGTQPGPSVMLRAELDALPIAETLDLEHASFSPGVAHKCGHDGHMAMLLGVAARMHTAPPARGRVMLLFQPAEENGTGAAAVMADPKFNHLHPQWIFALHNLPGYPVNTVLVTPGPFCAASAGIKITLTGKTSHAAYPEAGISPGRAMAQLVLELINLPDTITKDDHLALVTIVHSQLGQPAMGISPARATISATLRANRDKILTSLKDAARSCVEQIAASEKLQWSLTISDEFPAVFNDPQAVAIARDSARQLGLAVAAPAESPFRWSEDFGHLTARGRGALIGLGAGLDHPALHTEDFDFNDSLLPTGIALLTNICRRIPSGSLAK